jgi:adenylylsulfate kinase
LFGAGQFFEVYISTPFEVRRGATPKGLYRAALEGRLKAFTGLDSPYEAPLAADCEINTDEVDLTMAWRASWRCCLKIISLRP